MFENLFSVTNRVVLITGSSRGLGFSFAKGFGLLGSNVVLNGVVPEHLNQAVDQLSKMGVNANGYNFDVSDKDQVNSAIEKIEKEIGPIDVLINNAGIHRRALLEEMTVCDWKKVIDTNLTSSFIVSQAVVKYMKSRGHGKIINISSLNAEGARPTIGNYCASKGGLKMLTKSMATEWGKYNIQVNAIGPGYFITDLTRKLAEDPEFDSWVKKKVPLGRWGNPDELIGTAVYLASGASNYVTGFTVYVDGGWQASL